jgi:hypothetical protein
MEAEAATVPPEQWRDGEFVVGDYITEAVLVGVIEMIEDEDDRGHPLHRRRARPDYDQVAPVCDLARHLSGTSL